MISVDGSMAGGDNCLRALRIFQRTQSITLPFLWGRHKETIWDQVLHPRIRHLRSISFNQQGIVMPHMLRVLLDNNPHLMRMRIQSSPSELVNLTLAMRDRPGLIVNDSVAGDCDQCTQPRFVFRHMDRKDLACRFTDCDRRTQWTCDECDHASRESFCDVCKTTSHGVTSNCSRLDLEWSCEDCRPTPDQDPDRRCLACRQERVPNRCTSCNVNLCCSCMTRKHERC